jgi:hypothetical protein
MGQKNGDLLDEMVGQPLCTIGFPRERRLWFSYEEVHFAEAQRFYTSFKSIHRASIGIQGHVHLQVRFLGFRLDGLVRENLFSISLSLHLMHQYSLPLRV